MSKLFNVMGGVQVAFESVGSGVLPDEDFGLTAADENEALCIATEASEMALERLKCVQAMQAHLSVQKPCSAAYFTSLESYSPIVRSLGEKLGVKHLPSMEDFKNPHAAKDAHNFAMEGFKEMISKAWEKIKSFFRDFFKKIGLFIRRLVKANLDLESYETYCDQLIAKLNANDAKITDTSPMPSELPKLLAGKGDNTMNSDYVLNQGQVKILNLLEKVGQMSLQGGGGKLHQDLVDYEKSLKGFIQANTKGSQDSDQFDASLKLLNKTGFEMITSLFAHQLNSPKDIPSKAFESLIQHYERKDIEAEGFQVLSIADPYDPYRDLPRGVNMYLSHVNGSNFFICSSKDQGDSAVKTLEPIGKLNNLVVFHKQYKSTLGSFKAKGMDKDTDAIASAIDKILTLLQRDFSAMVESHKELKVSYTPEYLAHLFRLVITKNGKDPSTFYEALSVINEGLKDHPNTSDGAFNELVSQLFAAFETPTSNVDVCINDLKQITNSTHKDHLIAFIMSYIGLNQEVLGEMPAADGQSRSKQLRELNNFLSSLFLRLQSLYKGITTDFYSVLTELRYAVIKYIYDSAKRYSY